MASPRILLKARPTEAQLSDRVRPPRPEGLEIYLDGRDIAASDWLAVLNDRMAAVPREELALLVEGPLRSIDGRFFDLTRDTAANRAVVDRLTAFGRAVGARAACIHLIAPTQGLEGVSPAESAHIVDACVPLASYYVRRCVDSGMTPTVENIPPIARMRESRFMTSTIGCPPEHLVRLAEQVDRLRFTVDISHAQLYLNAASTGESAEPQLRALCSAMAAASPVRTMAEFVEPLRGRIETVHVSDAEGLLGEGLPYGQGSMDLDAAVDRLLPEARWIVTEVIEPDPDRSEHMRDAANRIDARRARLMGAAA